MIGDATDFAPVEEEGGSESEKTPPLELQMYWMTKTYGHMPNAGGLMDQPYFLMLCLNVCAESQARAEEIKRRILESKQNATHSS